jgi:tetratricopeptide (TPR) repeat protein
VGPEDRVSLSTTKFSLGLVRAAQGRDAEAEQLMQEAVAEMRRHDQVASERWALARVAEFHRSRGRHEEAQRYEERLAELGPSSTAPIA